MYDHSSVLAGKVAFVTGAASGIGAAIAQRFAQAGAHIALVVLEDDERAQTSLAAVQATGARGRVIVADVSDSNAVKRAFAEAERTLGTPTLLVNDAGVDALGKPVSELTDEEFEGAIRTNLFGPFYCTRSFLAGLGGGGAGAKIVNISSVHEELPRAGAAEYCASKGGLRNLTRCLALELAPRKINVNSIAPGMILTPMNQKDLDDSVKRKADEDTIPWKRGGMPEEIAELALFLVSPATDYVTGSTYVMDGGLMQNTGQGA